MKRLLLVAAALIIMGLLNAQETTNCEDNILKVDIPVQKIDTGDQELNELLYKRDLIKYLRTAYDLPEFIRTGDTEKDIKNFNLDLKLWYQEHPDFVDILNLRDYEQMRKYDASCYDEAPVYTKGCSASEEKAYNKRFNNWMAHHPDIPKLLGDDKASIEKHEREKAEFYQKYYKK